MADFPGRARIFLGLVMLAAAVRATAPLDWPLLASFLGAAGLALLVPRSWL
jgi:hypothetical protein